MREMELMPEWFLNQHLGLAVGTAERAMLDRLFDAHLRSAALAQPHVLSCIAIITRATCWCARRPIPAFLDFQDAVYGPVTYDAVSLLKDCYIAWPPARVRDWLLDYRRMLLDAGFALTGDAADFIRWFDLMDCSGTSRCWVFSHACSIVTASRAT